MAPKRETDREERQQYSKLSEIEKESKMQDGQHINVIRSYLDRFDTELSKNGHHIL